MSKLTLNSNTMLALQSAAGSGVFGSRAREIAQAITPPVDNNQAPPVVASPTPPNNAPLPAPARSFLDLVTKYKKPVLIGGGVLLVIGLILKFK